MRRNKIDGGWKGIPGPQKPRREKRKLSWISRYESFTTFDQTLFEKVVKFLIKISLFLTISRNNFLNNRKKSEIVDSTYEALSSDKFSFIPAGVALYFFVSFVPILLIVVWAISLFSDQNWSSILLDDVLNHIVPGIKNMIQTIDSTNTTVNIILVLFMISLIWFSSKGITKFNDSFVAIYDYEYNSNWLIKRFKGFFTVCAISIFFIVWSLTYLPLLGILKESFSPQVYEFFFYLTSFIYMIGFGYVGIGFIFIYLPPFKLKWKQINPGILTALLPTIFFVLIFGTITKFLNYEKFGPIGTFIYVLVFVLYLSYFLHAGIIINASYYRTYFSITMVKKKIIISKKIAMTMENIYRWLKQR